MTGQYPKILYTEEGLREGMQIEDENIPVEAKVELLDALSETGLKEIVVGSFVSPKYTPQMARIDEIVSKFTPKPGVTYTALALNARGIGARQGVCAAADALRGQWTAEPAGSPVRRFRPPQYQPLADAGNGRLGKCH